MDIRDNGYRRLSGGVVGAQHLDDDDALRKYTPSKDSSNEALDPDIDLDDDVNDYKPPSPDKNKEMTRGFFVDVPRHRLANVDYFDNEEKSDRFEFPQNEVGCNSIRCFIFKHAQF